MKGPATVYLERLGSFYGFVNAQLFGGFLTYAVVMLLFLCLLSKWVTWESKFVVRWRDSELINIHQSKEKIVKWLLLIIPSICYFLLVSKIAVYVTDRYLVPIYAILVVWILCSIFIIWKKLLEQKYWFVATCLFLTLMTVNSWKNCNWDYLYKDTKTLLSDTEKHSGSNCLYIYDERAKVMPSYCEITQYNSVTFYKADSIAAIANMDYILDEDLVVYIINTCDSAAILENIMEQCPLLNAYQKIGSYGYATSYYLYGNGIEAN